MNPTIVIEPSDEEKAEASFSGPTDLLDGSAEEIPPVPRDTSGSGGETDVAWGAWGALQLRQMHPVAIDPDSMQGLSSPIRGHYSPELLELGGSLTFILISSGVLTDAIATKRLVKLLLKFTSISPDILSLHGTTTVQDVFGSYEIDLGKPAGFPDFRQHPYLSSRASSSSTMSDDMAVIGHTIIIRNVARLLLLASNSTPVSFRAASKDISAMIRALLKETPVMGPGQGRLLLTRAMKEIWISLVLLCRHCSPSSWIVLDFCRLQ